MSYLSEDAVFYVIQYHDGGLVSAPNGCTPKLYKRKGQALDLAKRVRGTVFAVTLNTTGEVTSET